MANILEQVEKHRKEIKYEAVTLTLSEIVRMYENDPKEVQIGPDFQRLFRWGREKQSSFIESLILEIPIPPIFCYENEEGVWELLDGLQRYSTIIRFMSEQVQIPADVEGISNNDKEWHNDKANDLTTKLQLTKCDYLDLSGLTFDRLPVQLQRNLKRARLEVYVLKRETAKMYKYEVFKRLNRGGAVLEDQEVRNCSVRLIGNEFANYIQKLASNTTFQEALSVKEDRVKEAYAEEMILRYFAMKNYSSEFEHDVALFLDAYMENVTSKKLKFDYDQEEKTFNEIVAVIGTLDEKGKIFKSRRDDGTTSGPFSPNIFESVMVGMAENINTLKGVAAAEIEKKVISFVLTAKLKENSFLGAGSNTIKKLTGRLNLAKSIIK